MKIRRLIDVGSFFSWFNFGCHHGGGISKTTGLPHNFPCGRCAACRRQKSKEWIVRLAEENKVAKCAFFVTLTYNDFFLPSVEPYEYEVYSADMEKLFTAIAEPNQYQVGIDVVCKRDVQLWLKRIRRKMAKQNCKVRHFLVSEYGPQTHRPHYHAILFFNRLLNEREFHSLCLDTWIDPRSHAPIGNIETSLISSGRMMYVAKYATGITELPEHLQVKSYKPFLLSSRRRGIGYNFVQDERNIAYHRATNDRTYSLKVIPTAPVGGEMLLQGQKPRTFTYPLPKYYYYNMFSKEERYRMLLDTEKEKLDKYLDKIDKYVKLSGCEFGTDVHFYQSMIEDDKRHIATKNRKRKNL